MLDSQSINLLNVAPAVKAAFYRLLGVDVGLPGAVNGPGTANGATVSAAEYGVGPLRKTVLTCNKLPIALTDEAAVAQAGGVKVYDFPEGLLLTLGAVIDGALTGYASLIDTFAGGVALGTATATTGATLVGTEADIMPEVDIAAAVAEVAVCPAVSVATALTESGARHLDGTTTAKDMFLNFVVDDNAAHGSGTAFFTGTISFAWMILGDK